MRHLLTTFLFILASGTAIAQSGNDVQLRRLQAALDAVRQQQQAVYQQFQMTEALQRSELQSAEMANSSLFYPDGSPPSYEAAQQARADREYRLRNYAEEMQRLSAQFRDLEARAAPIVEQINDLARSRR